MVVFLEAYQVAGLFILCVRAHAVGVDTVGLLISFPLSFEEVI